MNHSWCSDPARDESVRAAEDNRQGPLPTLEQCIERARAMMAKSASGSSAVEQENKANGMRTERVTLEFEIDRGASPREWPWSYILSRSDALQMRPCESVRVVEEVALEPGWAERLSDERDALKARVAELESAPAASVAANSSAEPKSSEPVAWGVRMPGHPEWGKHAVWSSRNSEGLAKQAFNASEGWVHFPLYTAPPPARGWLTEEERRAVILAAEQAPESDFVLSSEGVWVRRVLSSLLARSSPPEVEGLPEKLFWSIGEPEPHWPTVKAVNDVIDKCRAAIAAAGVKVKEVGK